MNSRWIFAPICTDEMYGRFAITVAMAYVTPYVQSIRVSGEFR